MVNTVEIQLTDQREGKTMLNTISWIATAVVLNIIALLVEMIECTGLNPFILMNGITDLFGGLVSRTSQGDP
jgi:hydrogenase-4 membrane subunit HyfE